MQPNLIKSTCETSALIDKRVGHGSPEAFLLAWVAWEGLKVRLLVVGLAQMGLQVKEIYEVLERADINTHKKYDKLFMAVFGTLPKNTKGVGVTWSSIEQYREVRNRYVHGVRGTSPARLLVASRTISKAVLNVEWLSPLGVTTSGQRFSIGNPYSRLNASKTAHRSASSLRQFIRVSSSK